MMPHVECLRKPIIDTLEYDSDKLLVVGENSSIFVPEGFVGTTGTEKGIVLVGCLSVAMDFGNGAILTHHGVPFSYHARHLEEITTLRQTHKLSQPPIGARLFYRDRPRLDGSDPSEFQKAQDYKSYVSTFYDKLKTSLDGVVIGCLEYLYKEGMQVTICSGKVVLDRYSTSNPRLSA